MSNKIIRTVSTFLLVVIVGVFTACNRNNDTKAAQKAAAQAAMETDFTFENGAITGYNGTATDVVIPSQIQCQAVTVIYPMAFYQKQLTSVTIPDGVETIGMSAFAENQLTSVIFGNGLIAINEMAFAGNRLSNLTIPNSVTNIADGAFSNNQLTSIHIHDKVWIIGPDAFYNNKLTSIIIPDGVTAIGKDAFGNNPLTSITIERNDVELGHESGGSGETGFAFSQSFDKIYNSWGQVAGTYTLNNGVWSLSKAPNR